MSKRVPSYRHHKPSGLAVVTVNGRDHYLGQFGSTESREAYGLLIARHSAGISTEKDESDGQAGLDVNEVVLAFLRHAKKHYVKNGRPTAEYECYYSASKPLARLYGETQASNFGPLALRAVRDRMIELGWCRKYINKSVCRIRRMFRFAVSNELIKPEVVLALESLEPLLEGRSDAIELRARTAVPQKHIEAIRKAVDPRTRDMIDLALLTGARPGELVSITADMIDRTGDVWTVRLTDHKTSHRGKSRVLAFGPKAQVIVRKYLTSDPSARLFKVRRDQFSKNIVYWCDKLKLPRFTGHWLRHNAATDIRSACGLDGAQAILGHSHANTTEIYAHLDVTKIVDIARKHG